jgi:hypothetical protein
MTAGLYAILISYMIYGIVHVVKNKALGWPQKTIWIVVIVFLPVLGAAGYLRTNFKEKHGRW